MHLSSSVIHTARGRPPSVSIHLADFPLLKSCSLLVHPGPFSDTKPRSTILRGFVFSATYVGGRRWFRTTDPLLVKRGPAFHSIAVYSRMYCNFRYVEHSSLCPAPGYSRPSWGLMFTFVHLERSEARPRFDRSGSKDLKRESVCSGTSVQEHDDARNVCGPQARRSRRAPRARAGG